jgi:hypothetical protein
MASGDDRPADSVTIDTFNHVFIRMGTASHFFVLLRAKPIDWIVGWF